ncbi:MAG: hypothetical protein ACYTF0_07570 [Planctomycetota bacterium]|jgi:hypothetical protein
MIDHSAILADPSTLRAMVTGLAVGCPFEHALENCVLAQLRQIPLAQRLARLQQMSVDELRDIYRQHLACQQRRLDQEGPKPAAPIR